MQVGARVWLRWVGAWVAAARVWAWVCGRTCVCGWEVVWHGLHAPGGGGEAGASVSGVEGWQGRRATRGSVRAPPSQPKPHPPVRACARSRPLPPRCHLPLVPLSASPTPRAPLCLTPPTPLPGVVCSAIRVLRDARGLYRPPHAPRVPGPPGVRAGAAAGGWHGPRRGLRGVCARSHAGGASARSLAPLARAHAPARMHARTRTRTHVLHTKRRWWSSWARRRDGARAGSEPSCSERWPSCARLKPRGGRRSHRPLPPPPRQAERVPLRLSLASPPRPPPLGALHPSPATTCARSFVYASLLHSPLGTCALATLFPPPPARRRLTPTLAASSASACCPLVRAALLSPLLQQFGGEGGATKPPIRRCACPLPPSAALPAAPRPSAPTALHDAHCAGMGGIHPPHPHASCTCGSGRHATPGALRLYAQRGLQRVAGLPPRVPHAHGGARHHSS